MTEAGRPGACESGPRGPGSRGAAHCGETDRLAHGHAHGGGPASLAHGHAHGSRLTLTGEHRRSLVAVMLITVSVAVAEAVGAWISGALVLLADAAHMAADAAGVGLSLLAVLFAMRPATVQRTFGYARAEILADRKSVV